MFGDRDFDESFEDLFKRRHHEIELGQDRVNMGIQWLAYSVGTVIIVCIVVACCCRRRRTRGQIIATAAVPPVPPAPNTLPGGYPQQQYSAYPSVQVVTTYPVAQATAGPYPAGGHYPTAGAQYPTAGAQYPTAGAPYPNAGAPYPSAGAPYPAAGAPYPAAGAPYPTDGAPYPSAMPYPSAPNATDTLPPSYEQATGAKHPAYNPHVPH